MYFNKFPLINYDFVINDRIDIKNVIDITTNVRFIKKFIDDVVTYQYYDISDGETYEQISMNLYGSPSYHWVLMILNEAYNYTSDLPLDQRSYDEYIKNKYNKFVGSSWTYNSATSTVTVSFPDSHNIDVNDVITVADGYVTQPRTDIEKNQIIAQNFDLLYTVFAKTNTTIQFKASLNLTNKTPTGSLTIYTYEKQHQIKHYVYNGLIVDQNDENFPDKVAVTYDEFETTVNESKRRIKVVSSSGLSLIVNAFNNLVR